MLKNNVHGMTITELAKELDVSTKTIQRDLYEVLSDFGAIKEGRTWKIDPKLKEDNLASNEKMILGILDEWNYLKCYYAANSSKRDRSEFCVN